MSKGISEEFNQVSVKSERSAARTLALHIELAKAAEVGDIDRMKKALKSGADPHANLQSYTPALVAAAAVGQVDAVKFLISEHAGSDAGLMNRALIKAGEAGHFNIVMYLSNTGADICTDGGRMADIAAYHNDFGMLQFMRKRGIDLTEKSEYLTEMCARHDNAEMWRYLKDQKACDEGKSTFFISGYDAINVLEEEVKIDPMFLDQLFTPREAARKGSMKIFAYCCEQKTGFMAKKLPLAEDKMLEAAVENDQAKIFKYWHENMSNLEGKLENWFSAAARNGSANVLQYLYDIGADVFANNEEAMQEALSYGKQKIAQMISSWQKKERQCASIYALEENFFAGKCVNDLWAVAKGDSGAETGWVMAAKAGRFDQAVDLLRAQGVPMTVKILQSKDEDGYTVLDYLAGQKKLDMVFEPDLWGGNRQEFLKAWKENVPARIKYRSGLDVIGRVKDLARADNLAIIKRQGAKAASVRPRRRPKP